MDPRPSAPPKRRPFDLYTGDRSRTVKIQHNAGRGGCFPLHYDNPGPPSSRALTCILYLNPDWSEGDGGELQLIPFLRAPVRVNPRHGRLVVFLSDRVLHKVLPSEVERFCLTIWLDGSVNSPRDTRLNLPQTALKDIKKTADALHGSASQRALSRAVYPDEYEKSLLDCMGGGASRASLARFRFVHITFHPAPARFQDPPDPTASNPSTDPSTFSIKTTIPRRPPQSTAARRCSSRTPRT